METRALNAARAWLLDGGRARLDLTARQLVVAEVPAKLGGRAFDLLLALVEHRDRVVPKHELMDLVWPGLVVEENNLQVHVLTLRKLLGAQAIATVSGRGYRFALPATAADLIVARGAHGPTPALVSDGAVGAGDVQTPRSAGAVISGKPSEGLIGREGLLEHITALLSQQQTRLLTLTGAGGSGKTRLALHAAAKLAPGLADGAYVVMLSAVRDASHLMSAVATTLGLQEAGGVSPAAQVLSWLRERRVLLVLDNLEHLIDAAPQVAAMLQACAHLTVLATSRLLLRLSDEHEVKVPPLALPASTTMADIAASPAIALFAARAAAYGRDIRRSAEDMSAAAVICRRLDGLPLAIELAAARLQALTPAALATRMQNSLPLLKGGAADAPHRHQTLNDTIAWSHDLLDEPTRVLFRRLGVFVGGWSLAAAEKLADNATEAASTWERLECLLQHNLIQRLDDLDGEPRYAMLETIREYAIGVLSEAGEAATCESRRCEAVAEFVARISHLFQSGDRLRARSTYRVERGNVHAALNWAFGDSGRLPLQAHLLIHLSEAWYFDNDSQSGEAWFRLVDAEALPQGLRARVLLVGAEMANNVSQFATAMSRAQAAEIHALAAGDTSTWGRALCQQGLAQADLHTALDFLRRGADALFSVGKFRTGALALWSIGKRLTQEGGSDDQAESILLESRGHLLAFGDRWAAGIILLQLGVLAARRGDSIQALRHAAEGAVVAQEHEDTFGMAVAIHVNSRVAVAAGNAREAMHLEHRIVRMLVSDGDLRVAAMHCRWLAHLHVLCAELEAAARLFAASAGRFGDEHFLSLSTLSVDDRTDWTTSQAKLRNELPPEELQRLRREAMPWSLEQAVAYSESVVFA